MSAREQNAPTAANDSSVKPGSHAAAKGGAGRLPMTAPRSAHFDPALARAADIHVRHAKLDAAQVADGDKKRERHLIHLQGETLMLAGLRLLIEGGP